MFRAFHFYQVFNPMLNEHSVFPTQAHEFYFELKKRYQENQGSNNYLHWGKVSVTEAKDRFDHFKQALEFNERNGLSTHLYLTDYHHFWVAKVTDVKTELIDSTQTLPFYQNKNVNIWFQIEDFDLLSAEFAETSHYISQLYLDNQFSSSKIAQLNPYEGGLQFPLIVQDQLEESYFKTELRVTRKNMLIENPLVHAHMKQKITSFVLPPHIFKQLSFEGRQSILSSEQHLEEVASSATVREQVYSSYLSVMEESLDLVLGNILRESFSENLWVSPKGDKFSEESTKNFTQIGKFDSTIPLEGYFHLLNEHKTFGNLSMQIVEKDYSEIVNYFLQELKPFLEEREVLAKKSGLTKNESLNLNPQEVFELRNFVLGVGCLGVINTLLGQRIIWLSNSKLLSA